MLVLCQAVVRPLNMVRIFARKERIHSTILLKKAVVRPPVVSTPVSGAVIGAIFFVLVF